MIDISMTYIDVGVVVVVTTGVHTHTHTHTHTYKPSSNESTIFRSSFLGGFFFCSILHCIVPHDVILGRIKLGNTSKLTKTNINLNPYAI